LLSAGLLDIADWRARLSLGASEVWSRLLTDIRTWFESIIGAQLGLSLCSATETLSEVNATILDLAIEGDLALCADQRILDEYERVCGEPRLNLDPQAVRSVLEFLRATAERVVAHPNDTSGSVE
jgi:hypothetical protein